MASFRKNGWDIEPITVNKDYVIISGHHRLAAAVQAEIDIKYTIADVDYTSTQILKPNTLVAVITNNYTTGSVAKIKSDDFEFPLEEFIKVDNGAVPSTLKDKLDKYSTTIPKIPSIEVGIETLEGIYNRRCTSAPRIGNT